MKLEVAGIMALATLFVGYVITAVPVENCSPVEVIRYVRSPPEIQIKEVEKIINVHAACVKSEAVEESKVQEREPAHHQRRHRWRRRR